MSLKTDYKEFQQEIAKRGIEFLIHFTPTLNLYGIYEHQKLISRKTIKEADTEQIDIIDYVKFPDSLRFDDDSYINLSLSCPNTFLFSKFREKTKDDYLINWCVLKINPKLIYEEKTKFAVTNAASSAANNMGISTDLNKFKMMFAKNIPIPHGTRNNIQSKFPTNVQAEVLVKDFISLENVIEVCFQTENELSEARASLFEFDTSNFIVDKEIFSPNRSI
jgi:hypothetical protein